MKPRSAAGGSAHYYKFTGVTEIQCWTLYGESPGSLRSEDFNDKLRNEVPTPRTQGRRLGDVCLGKVFWVSLAGCSRWSEGITDLLSLWATIALALVHGHRCGSIQ